MDHRRRDHQRRGRADGNRLVLAPVGHIDGPGPAQVMAECALQRQRALPEIVMMMGRHLRGIARPVRGGQRVYHECRAAVDTAKPTGFFRHRQWVMSYFPAAHGLWPSLQGRDVATWRVIGAGVGAQGQQVCGVHREHAHRICTTGKRDATVARRLIAPPARIATRSALRLPPDWSP